jgi:hypothetical protein
VLLTRVRQRSLLCMFRSASDAIILSIIPRCLLHSSCRMRVRADACARKYHACRAHTFPYVVQCMHTHMCTRPSINICSHARTRARARTHTHTHSRSMQAPSLYLSPSLSLAHTHTNAHTHTTHNTVVRQFYIISLYYIHLSLLPPYESTHTHLHTPEGRGERV